MPLESCWSGSPSGWFYYRTKFHLTFIDFAYVGVLSYRKMIVGHQPYKSEVVKEIKQ